MCRGMSEVSRPISRDALMMHIMPAPLRALMAGRLPMRLSCAPFHQAHSRKTAAKQRPDAWVKWVDQCVAAELLSMCALAKPQDQ